MVEHLCMEAGAEQGSLCCAKARWCNNRCCMKMFCHVGSKASFAAASSDATTISSGRVL